MEINKFRYLDEAAEILCMLYVKNMRPSKIFRNLYSDTLITEPTMMSILNELRGEGFIKKIKHNKRWVEYEITDKGKNLVDEETAKSNEMALSILRKIPNYQEIRPEILKFACNMEEVMKKHDEQKGDSWKDCALEYLENKLDEEVNEFKDKKEIHDWNPCQIELIDISNICMMLFHRYDEENETERDYNRAFDKSR